MSYLFNERTLNIFTDASIKQNKNGTFVASSAAIAVDINHIQNNYIIDCDCSTKDYIETNIEEVDSDYLNEEDPNNINVLKCAYLLLKSKNIVSNPGFWAGTTIAISSISLCILTFGKEITEVFSSMASLVFNLPYYQQDERYFE